MVKIQLIASTLAGSASAFGGVACDELCAFSRDLEGLSAAQIAGGAVTQILSAFDGPKKGEHGYECTATDYEELSQLVDALPPVGSITARIAEASDALDNPLYIQDGGDGDIAFPHGNLKPIATVGEFNEATGEFIVGVPDGMGAYLFDEDTVRVIVQSESYGPIAGYEVYPFFVNGGASSFTGSHIQYVDYDRQGLSTFMEHEHSAAGLVKGMGELIQTAYNLKGELLGPRNLDGGATTTGAHFSNTDADGNYAIVAVPADPNSHWIMQSLCSASLSEPFQWGPGVGVPDRLFVTNEEWIQTGDSKYYTGLSAHVVDIATMTDYAVATFALGGFEKIVEINPQSEDHVAFAISGYNGAFGNNGQMLEAKTDISPTRADGTDWVWPQNVHPARIYVGRKGFNVNCEPADDFLSRNGLSCGQLYGFGVDESLADRDDWHRANYNGATVEGAFYPIDWKWDGVVKNFEHDAAWEYQEPPLNAPPSTKFWNGGGRDAAGSKTEHISAIPDGSRSAYVQTSTAGYYGEYALDLAGAGLGTNSLPVSISSTYSLYQGETDITAQINLEGKGVRADGNMQTHMCESSSCAPGNAEGYIGKNTFEDIDGFEVLRSADGDFALIQEDGGNRYGERTFISAMNFDGPPAFDFIAQSGGTYSTRLNAGVGIPAGTGRTGGTHEFSGVIDLSGMLHKTTGGGWCLAEDHTGVEKLECNAAVPINDKYVVVGLQAHSMAGGTIFGMRNDRGGQWYIYQPQIEGF